MAKTYDTYKDSGIAWIGEIPGEWEVLPIKYALSWKSEKGHGDAMVLSLYRDLGIVPKESRDDNHNVTSEKTDDYKFVCKGDFVINKMKAWQGSMALSNYEGIVSPAYYVCSFNNTKVYKQYFHHLLRNDSYLPEYRRLSTGLRVGQWDLGFDDFKNIPFLLPPLSVQQSISSFLDTKCGEIDSLISIQEEMISELLAYKQSVITEAVTKGLDKKAKMKNSGVEWIGDIPEEWEVVKINRLFSYMGGYAFNSNNYSKEETNYQVVRIGNVKNDYLKLEASPVYITKDISLIASKCKLKRGYIIFTMTGTKGKRDYFYTLLLKDYHFKEKELYLNQRVGCFIPISKQIDVRYYDYLLKDKSILDSIFLYETGTANQGNLGIETINRTLLQFPPLPVQQAIATYLDEKTSQIDSLIALKQSKIESLKEYKKSIIYEYVTGKKRV